MRTVGLVERGPLKQIQAGFAAARAAASTSVAVGGSSLFEQVRAAERRFLLRGAAPLLPVRVAVALRAFGESRGHAAHARNAGKQSVVCFGERFLKSLNNDQEVSATSAVSYQLARITNLEVYDPS